MAKFTDKISNLIDSQAPEFVVSDHPKFLEFVKSYFTFMESAEISVTSVQTTDGLQLESELNTDTSTLLLDASRLDTDRTQLDSGDKVILESSTYGKFTRGETITGQTSKATAIVLKEDLANGCLYISAQNKFIDGEEIVGASSNATAVLNDYKPNPVNTIQQLLQFRDPDKVISNFLTKFRNEFLNTIPENLDGKSFKAVLQGKASKHKTHVFGIQTSLNIHEGAPYPIRSVRGEKFKLIHNLIPDNNFSNVVTHNRWFEEELAEEKKAANDNYAGYLKRPEFELYNIIKDPFEQINIINQPQYTRQVAGLKKELAKWMEQQGDLGIETELSVCDRKGFNHRGCN